LFTQLSGNGLLLAFEGCVISVFWEFIREMLFEANYLMRTYVRQTTNITTIPL